jgi:FKBP-type peptidyl-prolyl cis-trans isomerase FklB
MKNVLFSVIGLVLMPGVGLTADKVELKNEFDNINYSVGYQIGGDFKAQGVELNPELLVQGVRDAINKNTPLLSQEQMNTTLGDLKKKIVTDQKAQEKQAAAENRRASAAFLAENAKQEGVTVLPSGVQYKVLRAGSGKKPTLKDEVTVHYRITRVDGKEVSSTYVGGKPRTYLLAKAIPGLQEVLTLMAEGAKWQIVLPGGTASGGRDPLDDMGTMIYEMELLSVSPAK